ncbi:MAG: hypothetical protein ACRDPL_01625, partial [Propionibacteriaceae bacterium]
MHVHAPSDVVPVRAPEDTHRQFGSARSHQTGDTDHLAGTDRQVGMVYHDASVLKRMVHRPVLNSQHLGSWP